MAVSSSASSKRARTLSSGTQNASCLVDGCTSDLSNCREYHRRHKVCECTPRPPFHLLAEFDEVKRSCRKRLDGHNRRRRKPSRRTPSTPVVSSPIARVCPPPPLFSAFISIHVIQV
ncbi:unnamed protein product [Spirodela intermedia]|uniref:SBP-type domain-containing protein n=1 Tax=Spirodela intermedia TaxID=51605 RepID=A0A7I8JCN3_SPIIN|nr:unnamed protein product [Spirodela intermedia]CAA6667869.1 unnamed protein product [Spirodela intermedia]